MRGNKKIGPSTTELKLRSDLDRVRREITKLKKAAGASAAASAPAAGDPAADGPGAAPPPDFEQRLADLEKARMRLGRLYVRQVEAAPRRADQLHAVLGVVGRPFDGAAVRETLHRIAEAAREHLGWHSVLVRLRDDHDHLQAVAFAGIRPAVRAQLEDEDVVLGDFTSWLRDEFRVSRSYFISHENAFSRVLPHGHASDLGERGAGEWHADDVLLVPLLEEDGTALGYLSVDDPVDRMVPSRESVQLLEVLASHAVAAIGFDRLQHRSEARHRDQHAAAGQVRGAAALRDRFVTVVARELHTPLAALRGHVAALRAGAAAERGPGGLEEECDRLAELVESVLGLCRFDPERATGHHETAELGELVDETAALLQPMAEAAEVHLKVAGPLADTGLDADRDALRQLLMLLAGHAVKVTPAGGTVTLRADGDDRTVTLHVDDTGSAVAGTDPEFPGLAACRAIAEAHGGAIEVSGTPAGTRIGVTLERHTPARVILNPAPAWNAATGEVIRLAVEMVSEVMSAGVVSLMAIEPDGDLVVRAAVGLEAAVVRGTRVRAGAGVAGWVAANRRPVCVRPDDPSADVRGSGRSHYQSGTFLSLPVEGPRGLIGVLNVTDPKGGRAFGSEDAALLLALVDGIARAWEGAADPAADAGAPDDDDALRTVLQHLRDTRGQSSRRVRLTHAVAREMGLPEEEVRMLGLAAAVHDVGMRAVNAGALDAAAPLTPQQRAAMQRHVEHGAGLLRPLEAIGALREVVLAHHEWWDGSGYPRGLAGTAIPAGARALAVVDAFESMTRGRPHRAAMSKHAALNEIVRRAGRQFDPDAVDALERALPKLKWDEAMHAADVAPSSADPGR
jgi:signal transduction histidine kinase/ribosomal protein L12E/L44/L45/RPP1/RPP2